MRCSGRCCGTCCRCSCGRYWRYCGRVYHLLEILNTAFLSRKNKGRRNLFSSLVETKLHNQCILIFSRDFSPLEYVNVFPAGCIKIKCFFFSPGCVHPENPLNGRVTLGFAARGRGIQDQLPEPAKWGGLVNQVDEHDLGGADYRGLK